MEKQEEMRKERSTRQDESEAEEGEKKALVVFQKYPRLSHRP